MKTKVSNSPCPHENQFLYSHLDLEEFVADTRVAAEVLLDESKCKVVSYETKRVFINEDVTRVFFL